MGVVSHKSKEHCKEQSYGYKRECSHEKPNTETGKMSHTLKHVNDCQPPLKLEEERNWRVWGQ